MFIFLEFLFLFSFPAYIITCGIYLNYLVYDHFTILGFIIGAVITWILSLFVFPYILIVPNLIAATILHRLSLPSEERSDFIPNIIFSALHPLSFLIIPIFLYYKMNNIKFLIALTLVVYILVGLEKFIDHDPVLRIKRKMKRGF